LAENAQQKDPNHDFVLDHSLLHKGKNVIAFEGKPFVKRNTWEEINTNPGTIKVYNPALQWKRKTFNGLAQILIRTTKQAGVITLTATSEGLTPATIEIIPNVVLSRPSTDDAN
jgi:beta-galactosidase